MLQVDLKIVILQIICVNRIFHYLPRSPLAPYEKTIRQIIFLLVYQESKLTVGPGCPGEASPC